MQYQAIERDRYGRVVATCSANGLDLGDAMVRGGFAVDFTRYSKGRYAGAEREAQGARRGLWAGQFMLPWKYRRER